MAMLEEKIVKKVPGHLCPNPREKQGFIEDLSSKTNAELTELLERQNKLLSNKAFIRKLPDKGERIKAFQERLIKTIAEKDQIERTCGLLSDLSLTKGNVTDEIEWTGKYTGVLNDKSSGNSSEDETNPLKILASHAGTGKYKKKKHRRLKEQNQLEENDQVSEISSALEMPEEGDGEKLVQSSEKDLVHSIEVEPFDDLHAKHLCSKVDKPQENKIAQFKPHCTTKSGMHPGLFIPKRVGPHWEVTAATPPHPVYGAAKLLTLQESLKLQQLQAAKLKDVQAKHASEKLASNSTVKLGSVMPDLSTRNEYRDTQHEYGSSNSSEAEENEGQSDEDEKRDTIVYTYTE